MAENVFAVKVQCLASVYRFGKGSIREGINQADQLVVFQLILTDTVQNTLELDVALFNLFQRVVYQPRDRAKFHVITGVVLPKYGAHRQHGFFLERTPAGSLRYPEHVRFAVVIQLFQFVL